MTTPKVKVKPGEETMRVVTHEDEQFAPLVRLTWKWVWRFPYYVRIPVAPIYGYE